MVEPHDDTNGKKPTNGEIYVFPTTVGQKRFWSLDSLEPGNPALNMPLAARLTGKLDRTILQQALNAVVHRHEILRSSFQTEGEEVMQVVHPPSARTIAWMERPNLAPDEVTAATRELMQQEALKPFNLAAGSLLRAAAVSFSEAEHLLMLTMHHIVCDGWSNGVLLREIAEHYSRLFSGETAQTADLPLQYGDYAVWQRDWLGGAEAEAQRTYWREHLGTELPVLNLPTDRPRGVRPTVNGRIHTLLLPREISEGLRVFCQQEKVTPFMLHLSAYVLLLHRCSGRRDFVVGSPAANRNQTELEGMIGLFANPLLFRFDIVPGMTFRQLLHQVRDLSLANFARQEYPFELVGEELHGDRSRRGVPWLQAYFIFQKAFMQPQEMPGLHLAPLRSTSSGAMFEWMLGVLERGEGVRLQLEYNTDLFDLETIERALGNLQTIAATALRHPDFVLDALDLHRSTPASFPLSDLPTPAGPGSLLERVTTAFENKAEALLLVYRDSRLSLADLRRHSGRIGELFTQFPEQPALRIAIGTADALFALVGTIAVSEAGHTAVLLPAVPTSGAFDAVLTGPLSAVTLQRVVPAGAALPGQRGLALRNDPASGLNSEHLIPVERLCHQADCVATGLRLRSSDTVLASAPLDQPLGWEEILAAWLRGATAVYDASCDTAPPVDVSVLLLPTAWWEDVIRRKAGPWPGVCAKARLVAVDRDPVSPAAIGAFGGPGSRLVQRFQPNEVGATVVIQTLRPAAGNEVPFPARAPAHWIGGWTCQVVDRQGNPTPDGIPGRLQVHASWLELPPASASSDWVRLRNDGSFEWIGAGIDLDLPPAYILEPMEIGAAACQHPSVWSGCVLPGVQDNTCVFVLHAVAGPETGISAEDLRAFLAERLPAYMVPTAVVVHARMPLTAAGRIDYAVLREPRWLAEAAREAVPDPTGTGAKSGPSSAQDEWERRLALLFAELLHLPDVNVRRSFFDLGGHSLLGVKLFARIEKEFHHRLPLATLLTSSSVRAIAHLLRQGQDNAARWSCLVPIQAEGTGPKFFCVHGAGGNVLLYRDLARRMAPTVRFYGLQAQGLDGRSECLTRIEDLAELYLKEILAEQPQGPYFVGGYCMGGNVAYEIARRLMLKGHTVGLVALLDCYNLRKSLYQGSVSDRFRLRVQKGYYHFDTLFHLSPKEQKIYLTEKTRMARELLQSLWRATRRDYKTLLASEHKGNHTVAFVQKANHIALTAHDPQPYAGDITLFHPRKNYFTFSDPRMGWGELVAGRTESVVVSTNPHAMLIEPFVQKLAAELNRRIIRQNPSQPPPGKN